MRTRIRKKRAADTQVKHRLMVPPSRPSLPYIQQKPLCPCDGNCPRCTGALQAKSAPGKPGIGGADNENAPANENQASSATEPQCPPTPTGLGYKEPDPKCAANPVKDIGFTGRHFHFCLDSDTLLVETAADISGFAKKHPAGTRFTVHGYASLDGGWVYNKRLACHRANRVVRDLMAAGIPVEQIETASKGATNEFPGGPDFNRVVVVDVEVPEQPEVPESVQTARCNDPAQAAQLQSLYRFAKLQMAESIALLHQHVANPGANPLVAEQIKKHFADIDVNDLIQLWENLAKELQRGHALICDNNRLQHHTGKYTGQICRGRTLASAPEMAPGGRLVFCPEFWPPKDPGGTRTPLDTSRRCEYKAATIIHEVAHNEFRKGHVIGEQGKINTYRDGIRNPFSYGFFAYEVTKNLKCK